MKNKCKHHNIIIRTDTSYHIKQGYDELSKKDNIDMEDYKVGFENTVTICDDCGTYIDN